MSHPTETGTPVVQAIINHHAQLEAGLHHRVKALVRAAAGDPTRGRAATDDLLAYLRAEILPHAAAEEEALYPPAAALIEGRALIAGMVAEHRALSELFAELADAGSPARAAAAARAFGAVFTVHVYKENELVVPLLSAAPGVDLGPLLAGMHDLLGEGGDHLDEGDEHAPEAAGSGGGGCGGTCGCGGDRGSANAPAPVLTVDTRIDVREIPHGQRHALILSAVAGLPPGQAVVLVAPHAPLPLLTEIANRFGEQVDAQWLQDGPEVWQVRLERAGAAA